MNGNTAEIRGRVQCNHSAYLCGPGRVVGGLKNNYRGLLVVGEVGGRER